MADIFFQDNGNGCMEEDGMQCDAMGCLWNILELSKSTLPTKVFLCAHKPWGWTNPAHGSSRFQDAYYHLVMTKIAMERSTHSYKWAIYTMAMLNNHRVYQEKSELNVDQHDASEPYISNSWGLAEFFQPLVLQWGGPMSFEKSDCLCPFRQWSTLVHKGKLVFHSSAQSQLCHRYGQVAGCCFCLTRKMLHHCNFLQQMSGASL